MRAPSSDFTKRPYRLPEERRAWLNGGVALMQDRLTKVVSDVAVTVREELDAVLSRLPEDNLQAVLHLLTAGVRGAGRMSGNGGGEAGSREDGRGVGQVGRR